MTGPSGRGPRENRDRASAGTRAILPGGASCLSYRWSKAIGGGSTEDQGLTGRCARTVAVRSSTACPQVYDSGPELERTDRIAVHRAGRRARHGRKDFRRAAGALPQT